MNDQRDNFKRTAFLLSDSSSTATSYHQERQKVIDRLTCHNYPALPVAPAQNSANYPKIEKAQGEKGKHCPLTEDLKPVPLYTGKNPSYLSSDGQPCLVSHSQYQDRLPSEEELSNWFVNPATGVGTLGGWNDTTWVDIDLKQFDSAEDCARQIEVLEATHPAFAETWKERTHSGGYRYAFKVNQKPSFTNFALEPGGKHRGEALGKGRFTVLAPTIGPSGNPYRNLKQCEPLRIESLESIGIYSTKTPKQNKSEQKTPRTCSTSTDASGIPLELLGHDTSSRILNGECPSGDRSEALATAAQEWLGWENWSQENNIPISGDATTLVKRAGEKLGIDSDRIERILATIDPAACHPAALYRGSDKSCWLKICRLNHAIYKEKCPPVVKNQISLKEKIKGSSTNPETDPYQQNNLDPSFDVGTRTVETLLLERLFESGKGVYISIDDAFCQYSGKGYWQLIPEKTVRKEIAHKLTQAYKLCKSKEDGSIFPVFSFATNQYASSVFNFCRDSLDVGNLPHNKHLLCFSNCTVDTRTGGTVPHNPKHYLRTRITANYELNQDCPKVFLDFIEAAYGKDLISYVRAITSMLLDPTAPYGWFVHLRGPSGSGKGTLLRFWGEMFGVENFRSIDSFGGLASEDKRHQSLTGAVLVAIPDIGGYVQGLKAFYELVDNGPMTGRALFSSNTYQKQWNCRFVIASVDYLQIENSGDGWDRWCLPLPTKLRQGNLDPKLGTKLAEVKGQVISWALAIPKDERDYLIIHPPTNERILLEKQNAALSGDPVRSFVDLCLRPDDTRNDTHGHLLHTWFNAFCREHGYKAWGMNHFLSHLKTVLPNHHVERRRATVKEDPLRKMIASHWIHLDCIPGTFGATEEDPNITQCIKWVCREGGLTQFEEFRSARSSTVPQSSQVPDPCKTTQCQEPQQNGSGGSNRSGTSPNLDKRPFQPAQHKGCGVTPQDASCGANTQENNKVTSPPAPDLPDPLDLNCGTPSPRGVNTDHSLVETSTGVLDPNKEPDPLHLGNRVRMDCPGLQLHGKLATVQRLKEHRGLPVAELRVDGEKRAWEAPVKWLNPVSS